MIKIFHYDLETTGIESVSHGIYQIACQVDIDGKVEERFSSYCKPHPSDRIDLKSLNKFGVAIEDLKNLPSGIVIASDMVKLINRHIDITNPKDKFFLSGFNIAHFDNPFFKKWLLQYGYSSDFFNAAFFSSPLDTFVLSSNILRHERAEMVSFDLPTICQRFNIEVDNKLLHDAAYDTELSRLLFNKINNIST
jgi:DNA polymerase-3 subunit epsilon